MDKELIYWGWLTLGNSPHSYRKWTILKDFAPKQIYNMVMSGENPGFSRTEFQKLKNLSLSEVECAIGECLESGINVYCPEDAEYPIKLLDIDNPPTLIFSSGDLKSMNNTPSVAIVGSRNADYYSLNSADKIACELGKRGITVVSGFARGVDSSAHNGALRSQGKTIAVVGCGIKYDYPKGTFSFKKQISQQGAVISEYFPNIAPASDNFKFRNRIISGISDAIIVVCAGKYSGTLNTVSHGNSQGKEIFVLPPHNIFDKNYLGNILLLRDGATPIYSIDDILRNIPYDDLKIMTSQMS